MKIFHCLAIGIAVTLTGCGGGGGADGAGSSTPTSSVVTCATSQVLQNGSCITPVPTVSVGLSTNMASVGSAVTLNWSSTNATSCVGLDSASAGTKGTSGTELVTQAKGGQFIFTISCTGAGGNTKSSVTLTVPFPVYSTSYENKQSIPLDDPTIPYLEDISGAVIEAGELEPGPRNLVWADFMQNGTLTVLTSSGYFRNVYPNDNPLHLADSPSRLMFLKKDGGKWSEITDKLIPNVAERFPCIGGTWMEVADFNNDGKPDVYLGCGSIDFPVLSAGSVRIDINEVWVLLSQADGTYSPRKMSVGLLYPHQCSAADFNQDGNIDVICVDRFVNQTPVILWGDGKGNFTLDVSAFPSDTHGSDVEFIKAIPVDGKLMVVASGRSKTYGTKILEYIGGKFVTTRYLTANIASLPVTVGDYNGALDIYYERGLLYIMEMNGVYQAFSLISVSLVDGTAALLSQRPGPDVATEVDNIKITSRHSLVAQVGLCSPSQMQYQPYQRTACNWEYILK